MLPVPLGCGYCHEEPRHREQNTLTSCDKFLILGCQRSGTTLVGMALEAHRDIELIEEINPRFHTSYALTQQIDLQAVREYRPVDGLIAGFKAPRDAHRSAEAISLVPGIKLIWISRDIHQVVASMLTLYFNGTTPWALEYAPREIIKYLYAVKADYEIAGSYQRAQALQDARQLAVAMATICWLSKQRSEAQSCASWPEQTFRVNYNDLVTRPEDTLSALLQFLGLDWDPSVLGHSELLSGEIRPGAASATRSIDTSSLDKWENVLSGGDLDLIDSILKQVQTAPG